MTSWLASRRSSCAAGVGLLMACLVAVKQSWSTHHSTLDPAPAQIYIPSQDPEGRSLVRSFRLTDFSTRFIGCLAVGDACRQGRVFFCSPSSGLEVGSIVDDSADRNHSHKFDHS